jgi:hypothetical protein
MNFKCMDAIKVGLMTTLTKIVSILDPSFGRSLWGAHSKKWSQIFGDRDRTLS